jgi:hypothetical protein
MEDLERPSDQVRVAIPIRLRGMSKQNRFFDEQTDTELVGPQIVVTRIRSLVDLETEVHLTSLKTNVGGTFRVIWVNMRENNGFHAVGLELLDPEGELWEIEFPAPKPEAAQTIPQVWLECQRCHQKILTAVPEAPGEFLSEGFLIARHCETCKATTAWGITTESEPALVEPEAVEAAPAPAEAVPEPMQKPHEDLRSKGRAPLQMLIKVIRLKYGTAFDDICTTANVSRTGAYFLSQQHYDVGEMVNVVLPYKEGDVAIPVPARVVRQDEAKEGFHRGIAIHLETGKM